MKSKMTLKYTKNRKHDNKVQLDTFVKYQGMCAAYILMAKRVTRGYHGLACMLVHLNNGYRREIQYYKDPHTLLKDLSQREQKHVNN